MKQKKQNFTKDELHEDVFPYSTTTFWRVYSKLYWPNINTVIEQPGLKELSAAIWKAVSESRKATGAKLNQPIRILALGFGFGGTELPLLYALKKYSSLPIELVAVEKQARLLEFARTILTKSGGILGIPETTEDLLKWFDKKGISESKKYKEWGETFDRFSIGKDWEPYKPYTFSAGTDKFHFCQDDLLWEEYEPSHLYPRPSKWCDRLNKSLGKQDKLGKDFRFDIVITAFCLFHLPL